MFLPHCVDMGLESMNVLSELNKEIIICGNKMYNYNIIPVFIYLIMAAVGCYAKSNICELLSRIINYLTKKSVRELVLIYVFALFLFTILLSFMLYNRGILYSLIGIEPINGVGYCIYSMNVVVFFKSMFAPLSILVSKKKTDVILLEFIHLPHYF